MKDEPDSLGGNNFKKQHSTSMGDGERGSLGEPDTYDWDDENDVNEPGIQKDKDKSKRGWEPVKENDVVTWDNTKEKPKNKKHFENL